MNIITAPQLCSKRQKYWSSLLEQYQRWLASGGFYADDGTTPVPVLPDFQTLSDDPLLRDFYAESLRVLAVAMQPEAAMQTAGPARARKRR